LRCLALDGIQNEGPALADNGKGSGFSPGRVIGDYELLEEVGHGGMGVVFKARQNRLERVVAIKVLRAGWLAKAGELARFRSEARTLAGLHHPNIVAVHEVGEHDGQPYFSMDFVAGRTLEELARGHPLPQSRAAQYVRRIAEAIQYAHEHDVLHRDLKPSNVIIDGDDQPRVTDFGLAKRLEGDSDLTMTGQLLGSPNFMPPEQASAGRGEVGPASDVYSLGALLYHLLTGRPPFLCETITDTLRQVAENNPASPRLLVPTVPKDLETICLKCLQKEPKQRYASAQAVADDLGRFLRDEPIQARPSGVAEKLWRWCRRNRALAVSGGIGAALVLTVAIGSPIAAIRINSERKLARAAERRTEQQLYAALLEQARATTLTGELGHRVHALDAVRLAGAISNSAALRGVAIATLALPDLRLEREWPMSPGTTLAILDPGFERIALCYGSGPVEIRSVAGQRLLASLPASTNLAAYVGLWSPDGRFFAVSRDRDTTGLKKDVEVWEVPSAKRVLLRTSTSGAMSFHPRSPRIMIGESPADVGIWNLETGKELKRYSLKARPETLKFSPDGDHFAAIFQSRPGWTITIYESEDGTARASQVFADRAREPAWHPHGQWLAVPDMSGTVHWMDAQTGETRVLGRHKTAAVRAFFSPEGDYLFTSGWDRQVICWDVQALRSAFTVGLGSFQVQFSKDGSQVAMLTEVDVRLEFHAFERGALCREFAEDLGGSRNYAAFSPDYRWLAACGAERLVVWDLNSAGPGAVVDEARNTRVAFASNGELFASRPGECFRWRVRAGTNGSAPALEPLALSKPAGFVSLCLLSSGVAFTGTQGSTVASFGQLATEPADWKPTADGLTGVSLDGRWLGMFRPYSQNFYVYQLPGFQQVAGFTHDGMIGQFEFSPRGEEVAICHRKGVEFWNTSNWQRTRYLTNFTSAVYSPDGQTIWLATDFRSAGLYDARTVELLLPLPRGTLPLALSLDGRYLAVSVDLRRPQVWDLVELRARLRELGLDWADRSIQSRVSKTVR
jgi:WD40 repeat protein/tRNA A-37 threonylcarbamoyl transferase component Bud32